MFKISGQGESIKVYGRLEIFDGDKLVYQSKNMVVTSGLNSVVRLLYGTTGHFPDRIAIGNGKLESYPPQVSDLELGHEIGRNVVTSKTQDLVNNVIVLETSFNSDDYIEGDFGTGDQVINEVGMFTNAENMFSRLTAANDIPFSILDEITYTIRWTVGVH